MCIIPSINATKLEYALINLNTSGPMDGFCDVGQVKFILPGSPFGFEDRCCCWGVQFIPDGPEKCATCLSGTVDMPFSELIRINIELDGPDVGYCDPGTEKLLTDGTSIGINKKKCCCAPTYQSVESFSFQSISTVPSYFSSSSPKKC
jgi:hypothetical protein